MRKYGFTLAEVLITLMIIGIVAALTIPSVISNYQQQEFKTGLKKAVSVLNEAIQTNIAVDGETPYENDDLFTYLQRHMSVIKQIQGSSYSWYNPTLRTGDSSAKNNAFYTTDSFRFEVPKEGGLTRGIILQESGYHLFPNSHIQPNGEETRVSAWCGAYGLSDNINNTINPPCVVLVDVNGDRKPTIYASNREVTAADILKDNYVFPSPSDKKITDIFNILITDEKAIPFGVVAQRAMYSK